MLVLSRKSGESVMVGGGGGFLGTLKVTVLAIASGKVRLGFEDAADVPIYRSEIWQRMSVKGELEKPDSSPEAPLVPSG